MLRPTTGSILLGAAAAALVLTDIFLVEHKSARRNAGKPWDVTLSARARREIERYRSLGMDRELAKIKRVLSELEENPFNPADGFKYVRTLGAYTRNIDFRRRITFTIDKDKNSVHVTDLWSHNRTNG